MNAPATSLLDRSHLVGGTCFVVPHALPPAHCRALRARAEREGFRSPSPAYPPSYRTNQRLVVDDPVLARDLVSDLAPHLPAAWRDDHGRDCPVVDINERIRFCRYAQGQWFSTHRDGVFHRSPTERSALTIMVYLNDEFEGGHTRFFARQHDPDPTWTYRPRVGSLIVFDHRLWHDGAPVTSGDKVVLRSDLMVRHRGLVDAGPSLGEPLERHRGYIWGAVSCADGAIVTSGRDRTLRRWRRDSGYRLDRVWATDRPSSRALAVDPRGGLWSGSRDGTIRHWHTDGEGTTWSAHDGAVVALAPHAGAMWSAGADARIVRWAYPGREGDVLDGHRGWVWALVSDGDALWSAGEDGTLRRWGDGSSELVFRSRSPLRALVRLGDAVAFGAADGQVRLVQHGRVVWRRQAHRGAVTALAVASDGRLLSGGEDGAVLAWDRGRPELVGRHRDFVTGLLDVGDAILSVGYDGAKLTSVSPSPRPRTASSGRRTRSDPTDRAW